MMVYTTYNRSTNMARALVFMMMIMTPEMAAAMDPTDRSMPPAVMTKVAPTAMMPMKAERVRRLVRLPSLTKAGFSRKPMMQRIRRATAGPIVLKSMEDLLAGLAAVSSDAVIMVNGVPPVSARRRSA